ncbi:hypothetical protein MMPV_008776 [Pyropia vietnamensis]
MASDTGATSGGCDGSATFPSSAADPRYALPTPSSATAAAKRIPLLAITPVDTATTSPGRGLSTVGVPVGRRTVVTAGARHSPGTIVGGEFDGCHLGSVTVDLLVWAPVKSPSVVSPGVTAYEADTRELALFVASDKAPPT